MEDRSSLIYLATLAQSVQRYYQMFEYLRQAIDIDPVLNVQERNLFRTACKNISSSIRTPYRIISGIIIRQNNPRLREIAQGMQTKMINQFKAQCHKVIDIVENKLLPNAKQSEDKIFYLKMQAQYWRNLCDFSLRSQEQYKLAKLKSAQAYETARKLVQAQIQPTNPIRLGLALSQSVWIYEIENHVEKAYNIATLAFDDAMQKIDQIEQQHYKDATTIMQLLKDNFTLWKLQIQQKNDNTMRIL